MKIALVGATGLVGSKMRKVLEERGFGQCEFLPAASAKSVGKKVTFVANLEPRKLMGLESCGMLLSAESEDGKFKLAFADESVYNGARLC